MGKTIGKIAAIVLVILMVLMSVGYNLVTVYNSTMTGYMQQGFNTAVIQISNTAVQQKKVDLPTYGQDGKQTGTITLIPQEPKK
jgi:hypothetical protein